jgi:putative membrane protein
MNQTLTDQERIRLDQRIAEAEKRTGAQIVLAVIERSDSYAELPWKAFALGASIAGLLVSLTVLFRPEWTTPATILTAVVVTLAIGGTAALLCIFVPQFARLFLHTHRAEVEVREHAKSLFLSHELFATHKRTGLLLLVSLFERQIVILPDTGLRKCLSPDAMHGIIASMTPVLAAGRTAYALEEGLKRLEDVLSAAAHAQSGKNELPDEIIEEKGA